MASQRIKQINSLLQKIISQSLHDHIGLDKFKIITIRDVDTSADLKNSTVWVSAYQNEDDLVPALNKAQRYIQKDISSQLSIRRVPTLLFKLDKSSKIDLILESL